MLLPTRRSCRLPACECEFEYDLVRQLPGIGAQLTLRSGIAPADSFQQAMKCAVRRTADTTPDQSLPVAPDPRVLHGGAQINALSHRVRKAGKEAQLEMEAMLTEHLKQIADVEVRWQPAKIFRRDRVKTVTISSDLAPGISAAEVNAAVTPLLSDASRGWARGDGWSLGGESEASKEANASIMAKLPIAAMIIVLLLVSQFNSLRRAGIVLITIPLGVIGVIAGHVLFGFHLQFLSMIGFLALTGIVVNDSLILVEFAKRLRAQGVERVEAMVEAGRVRIRPILLTTATTVAGLMPLALSPSTLWPPLAWAMISGLLASTVLTLLVVPVFYTFFDDLGLVTELHAYLKDQKII